MKELIIEAKDENLKTVLDFVRVELEAADCSVKLQKQITVAVGEIFVNIAHYAYNEVSRFAQPSEALPRSTACGSYNPETGGAVIRLAVGDEIRIEFEDSGKPYNPLEKADPDITAGVEEREIGGLGIFMVKKFMDTVEYEYKDGKNILTIKKSL